MRFIDGKKLSRKQEQVRKFLEVFFSASVKFVESSTKEICSERGIGFSENEKRQSYSLNQNERLIIVYEHHDIIKQKEEKKELFRILIESELSSKIPPVYYDNTSVIISEFFNDDRNKTFIDFYDFNSIDVLSKTLISYMMATSAFDKGYIF